MTLAFVFPGQGSQSVGMLADLADRNASVRQTFDEASTALGQDLWTIAQHGPAATLNQTRITQPVMLAAGIAVWRVWQERGGAMPAMLAGHSLGEYAALVCAGSIDFSDAVRLVALRGRLMQEAVPDGQGAMAALLGLDDDQVRALCTAEQAGGVVEAVNFNAPGQVVVAGDTDAVARVVAAAKAAGARRALELPVSVPSHCALMRPAAERLASTLAELVIEPPMIPVIHNVDVTSHTDPDRIRQALAAQLYSPVRWVETVRALVDAGVDRLVESGPGRVLAGLSKRIDKGITAYAVFDSESLDKALGACET